MLADADESAPPPWLKSVDGGLTAELPYDFVDNGKRVSGVSKRHLTKDQLRDFRRNLNVDQPDLIKAVVEVFSEWRARGSTGGGHDKWLDEFVPKLTNAANRRKRMKADMARGVAETNALVPPAVTGSTMGTLSIERMNQKISL